ncbi:hypothetical protein AVEN_62872-1 [Araneus ventricosus]|uniref:Uncharacterized protein n=2 Tax=Araneus ventricosus TaxID=182803 RepID=A0A4Y2J4R4_ARAVE|nr:hypothetical protein AVEN_62872-1 [Araneus ventricosus]
MGPCDDLPAKPELLHWGTMRRARRDLVTRLCCASVNSAIKEHGVMCRLTATAFDENDPSVRTLMHKKNIIRQRRREMVVFFFVYFNKDIMDNITCYNLAPNFSLFVKR